MLIKSIVKAKKLLTDELIKVGGTMYRVEDVKDTDLDKLCISFYALRHPHASSTLIVPRNMRFKVYTEV